jgi:hypothetical protein
MSPAAIAGVRGRPYLAEPLPWVGSGTSQGWPLMVGGRPKVWELWNNPKGRVDLPAASPWLLRSRVSNTPGVCPQRAAAVASSPPGHRAVRGGGSIAAWGLDLGRAGAQETPKSHKATGALSGRPYDHWAKPVGHRLAPTPARPDGPRPGPSPGAVALLNRPEPLACGVQGGPRPMAGTRKVLGGGGALLSPFLTSWSTADGSVAKLLFREFGRL